MRITQSPSSAAIVDVHAGAPAYEEGENSPVQGLNHLDSYRPGSRSAAMNPFRGPIFAIRTSVSRHVVELGPTSSIIPQMSQDPIRHYPYPNPLIPSYLERGLLAEPSTRPDFHSEASQARFLATMNRCFWGRTSCNPNNEPGTIHLPI
jgi:hypothetical protein